MSPEPVRRALVTGATGFVGSHLTRRLLQDGWQVSVVVRPQSSLAALDDCLPRLAVLRHDGTTQGLMALLQQAQADVVFHLAALFVAEHTPADIVPLIAGNILFSTQLAEAMAAGGCSCLVNTGSSWQYDDAGYAPVNLYAATKQAGVDILAYYGSALGLRVTTLTLFDTYGPNDPRRKLFTLLLQALREGTPLSLSPGQQLIDLVYIDDVVDAYVRCAELLPQQRAWHEQYGVSSGTPRSLREIVDIMAGVAGTAIPVRWGERAYRRREVMLPWSKCVAPPGWRARISLPEGIARIMKEPWPSPSP